MAEESSLRREPSLSEAPRILIVLMGALGDVVRGLCVVDPIKAFRPNALVAWLVEPACRGIVSLHPGIDEVIVFDRSRGVFAVPTLAKTLRTHRFDVVLDLQRHFKSGFFSWLSGAPRRIGFHRNDSKEGNWLFSTERIPYRGDAVSKVEHYQSFLDAVGVPRLPVGVSGLRSVSRETLKEEISSGLPLRYVGMVLGSSWDSKDWLEEGYLGLIRLILSETSHGVVLLGDKTKRALGVSLSAAVASPRVVTLAGETNLKELVGVLCGADVVVGPDSGPGHICGALGVPHVTIFGPTPVGRNAPRGSEHLTVVSSVGCSPCRRRVCPGLGKVCMRLVSPEVVFEKVQQALTPAEVPYQGER